MEISSECKNIIDEENKKIKRRKNKKNKKIIMLNITVCIQIKRYKSNKKKGIKQLAY